MNNRTAHSKLTAILLFILGIACVIPLIEILFGHWGYYPYNSLHLYIFLAALAPLFISYSLVLVFQNNGVKRKFSLYIIFSIALFMAGACAILCALLTFYDIPLLNILNILMLLLFAICMIGTVYLIKKCIKLKSEENDCLFETTKNNLMNYYRKFGVEFSSEELASIIKDFPSETEKSKQAQYFYSFIPPLAQSPETFKKYAQFYFNELLNKFCNQPNIKFEVTSFFRKNYGGFDTLTTPDTIMLIYNAQQSASSDNINIFCFNYELLALSLLFSCLEKCKGVLGENADQIINKLYKYAIDNGYKLNKNVIPFKN